MKYANHSNTNGPKDYYTKWRKSERERQILYDITCMCNLKKKNLFTKQKQAHRLGKQTYGCHMGKVGWENR